jgi:hypothetical protein
MEFVNPFTRPGKWYKANFHAHSTTSDGQRPPAAVAAHYRRHGYHILALTDHGRSNDVAPLARKDFLVINGAEYGVPLPPGAGAADGHHLVALNVPRDFAPDAAAATDANAFIRSVKAAGGETVLAHPNWCKHRYDQFAYIEGYAAMEVFNATCDEIGRADSETDWTHLLDAGHVVPAVAVDDAHAYPRDACRGWVWMKLGKLTAGHVMDALRTGCYFSSTGPRITDFRIEHGRIRLRCSPAQAVYFVVHQPFGGAAYRADGKPIREVEMGLPPDWTCFRAVVVDAAGRRAWTNPVFFGDAQCAEVRRKFLASMEASWKTPYRSAARASARDWQPLDLGSHVNRPLVGKDAWIADGFELNHLPAGAHTIQGVPFRIVDPAAAGGNAAIVLKSLKMQVSGGKPVPEAVTLPVNRTCRAVYFLHGAGFVSDHEKVAAYEFVYADGTVAAADVLALGAPVNNRRTMAQRERRSAIQDWWPTHPQFAGVHARKVLVAPRDNPALHRVLYTLEWINPHPQTILKEIRLRSVPTSSPVVLVLAVTVRVAGRATA